MTFNGLMLKEGVAYRYRNGEKCEPLVRGDNGWLFDRNGYAFSDSEETGNLIYATKRNQDPYDIVGEWEE